MLTTTIANFRNSRNTNASALRSVAQKFPMFASEVTDFETDLHNLEVEGHHLCQWGDTSAQGATELVRRGEQAIARIDELVRWQRTWA